MPTERTDDPADNVGDNPEGRDNQPTDILAQASTEEPPESQEEKVQQVKHSDFKRIKEEARTKGRQAAFSELDQAAQAAGFTSYADALKALAELKKSPPPAKPAMIQPQPQGTQTMSIKPKTDTKAADQQRIEALKAAEERTTMRKQWRAEERRRRELQEQLDAKEAEMSLREELYRAGVHDVDYALRLLTRQLEGKNEEEIGAFDRNAFYTGLRKEKPYLFGETVAPATTGTNGVKPDGSSPVAPAPGGAAIDQAQQNQFNARTAKPQEISDRLRALGLNPHA
jgi:hypothetical protein